MKKLKTSLIITTYNWPEALLLVLKSVEEQSIRPDEVVIADDGSKEETTNIIKKFSQKTKLNIIHSWQEDIGYRLSMSRNKAIKKSKGEYIVMIDGDMILHPNFIEDHINFARQRTFVQGVRAKISDSKSKEILKNHSILFKQFDVSLKSKRYSIRNKLLSFLFSGKKYFNKLNMFLGCNMAFFRKDCLNINGFNEDFIGWGRDDSEFGARMLHSGLDRRDLRFSAVAYHIHHEGNSRAMLERNHQIYLDILKRKIIRCENGIDKYI
jgi:glycosyltransferase involved in cell wall biosynthesis